MPRGRKKHHRDIGSGGNTQPVNKQLPSSRLDEWRTIRHLGTGAHGAVYEVESRIKPGKRAALKILNHLLQDERAHRRFKQEANAARLVRHPNVVEVFDSDVTEDGKCYVLMELLEGRRLDLLSLPLPIHQALGIGADVAAALSAAHAHGVVHRDVKPQNILLSRESNGAERVKLLDFGIAKLLDPEQSSPNTATGERLGTPAYMAPEQWRCVREIDGRADVYALGISLYELLIGRQPFQASNDYEWGQVRDKQELPQPDSFLKLPSEVRTLILTMVEKDREKRPQQMSQLAVELRKLSETLYVPPLPLVRPRRYATTGLLLLSLISLISNDRVEDKISTVRFPTAWGQRNRKEILSIRQRGFLDGPPQGQEDDPIEETEPSDGVATEPTHLGRPLLDSVERPRAFPVVENLRSGWPLVWPGFSNGRVSTPQKAGRGGGVQSHTGFQVRLVWRTPLPAQTTTLRISSGSRSILPDNSVLAGTADEGWFQYRSDTLTLDPAVQKETHGFLLFEARDPFGCLLAVGKMTPEDVMSEATHYVSLDTPNREEFLELKVEHQPRSGDGTVRPGVLLVQDSQQTPLIDCGSRCRCWVPRRTTLHLVGLGGERTPFAEWSIPSCKQSSRCVLTESELRVAQTDRIAGIFLAWRKEEDEWETLLPHPIVLNPDLQRYYHTREQEEFANPTQLRAIASNRSGSFWLAGRGGVLMQWDGLLRSLVKNQVGEADPAAPTSSCQELGCMVGRTTDFYSVSQQRDGIAYAVGHREFRGREARATAFRFDGENWTPTAIVSGTATSSIAPDLDTMKSLLSVWNSPAGNRILTVGYSGGLIDSAVGTIPNPDPFARNLWSVTGNEAGWILMAGGSNQPRKGPIVMMMAPGGKPVVQDSLRLVDGSPMPNITLRAAWLSPDGRDVWLGGLSGPLYQYERDERGQLVPTTVCEKGALSIRILSMWGTAKNNVWAASRNRVLHCDGTNPWTIRHTAPPGVEFTGIAGDPTGEIWVVGFYKAPDQQPGPTGPNDFAYVARLRSENRPRAGESFLPRDEVVSEQSGAPPERSVN